MAEVLWYYAKNDQQLGPVSPAELKQLAATRALLPEDLIWREGMESWAPATKVKGLFPEVREPVATPSPVTNAPIETPPTTVAAMANLSDVTPSGPTASEVPTDIFSPAVAASSAESRAAARFVENQNGERPVGVEMVDLLWLGQVVLWALCIAIVFLGGLFCTRAFINAENSMDEAAAAAVFSTFFIGAYVVARAGERIAMLLQTYFERRRK
jgi:hypothetical protein